MTDSRSRGENTVDGKQGASPRPALPSPSPPRASLQPSESPLSGEPSHALSKSDGHEVLERVRAVLERLCHADGPAGMKLDIEALFDSADSPESQLEAAGDLLRDMDAVGVSAATDGVTYSLDHSSRSARMFGEFRLIRHIRTGGFGQVYLARQCTVGRNVALKILPPVTPANLREILRFLREAKTAGSVDHPAIVTVLAAGIQARHPYIAMRYVDGETLAEKIRRARDSTLRGSFASIFRLAESGNSDALPKEPVGQRLETGAGPASSRDMQRLVAFFEKAARALHEAHKAGLIHRDIKPGNIMVNSEGEPVILDFGLAQEAAQHREITRTGELAGTPPYMSPEQISSRIRLDARTDVYSLAVTLYECLTLDRPFKAEPRDALYQEILAKPPPNVRLQNPYISRDLRVVLEKALAKDRDLRYGTALEFAEDLRRVRKHRAIHARAPGVHRKLWQAIRLLPVHAWLVGALLAALVILQVFTTVRLVEELETPEASRTAADPPAGRE